MSNPTTTSHVNNALFTLYDSLSDEKKAMMREVFSEKEVDTVTPDRYSNGT